MNDIKTLDLGTIEGEFDDLLDIVENLLSRATSTEGRMEILITIDDDEGGGKDVNITAKRGNALKVNEA